MCCITKFLIILVLVLSFCQCTLYRYSLIVHYVMIWFQCINLYCIDKIISIGILLFTLILYCAYCYANDKFYMHFDGSLECLINKQTFIVVRLQKTGKKMVSATKSLRLYKHSYSAINGQYMHYNLHKRTNTAHYSYMMYTEKVRLNYGSCSLKKWLSLHPMFSNKWTIIQINSQFYYVFKM